MTSVDCVLSAGAELGESPVWDARHGLLYWVDINGRAVHAFDPEAGTDRIWELAVRPSAIAQTVDPHRLLVAAENQLAWLALGSGELSPWVTLERSRRTVRLNDGRPDPSGRFWVGGMYLPGRAAGLLRRLGADPGIRFKAWLHRIEPDGSFATVRRDVGCANGLAFSPDGSVMYWADTRRQMIWSYDYDVDTGEPRNERVFLDFDPLPGGPDGACVDETGCYWIACVGGSAVLRVTPDGRVDRTIELPTKRPTMPAFGGSDLRTMFITSIGEREPGKDGPGPHGAIYAFDPGVAGMPEPRFGG
jgi:sugar lactone lactonase YvrE